MPLPQEKIYTVEDIYALPAGQRAELIDGEIFYMAPPNTAHQRISSVLHAAIFNYIRDNGGPVLHSFSEAISCHIYPGFTISLSDLDLKAAASDP